MTPAATLEAAALGPDHPVTIFRRVFDTLRPATPMPLADLYATDVVFDDPLHHIEGREALARYFQRLNAGLIEGRFVFGDGLVGPNAAMLPWTMRLHLKRFRRPIVVPGCSHLRFDSLVTHQRDYLDAGALIYEHVPLLGAIVRRIKGLV
jgi:SnoaL-like domain